MPACRNYLGWITLFAGGDLSDRKAGRLRAHLAECEQCAEALSQFRADRRELRLYGRATRDTVGVADEDWWTDVVRRLDEDGPESRRRPIAPVRRISGARAFSLAAGLLIAVFVGFRAADVYLSEGAGAEDSALLEDSAKTGVPIFHVGSERVAYPILNFSHSTPSIGIEPDVDEESKTMHLPGLAAPTDGPTPSPRARRY